MREGFGIAVLPCAVSEGLVPVLPAVKPPPLPLYLVAAEGALKRPHVRLVADRLAEGLSGMLKRAGR